VCSSAESACDHETIRRNVGPSAIDGPGVVEELSCYYKQRLFHRLNDIDESADAVNAIAREHAALGQHLVDRTEARKALQIARKRILQSNASFSELHSANDEEDAEQEDVLQQRMTEVATEHEHRLRSLVEGSRELAQHSRSNESHVDYCPQGGAWFRPAVMTFFGARENRRSQCRRPLMRVCCMRMQT
jgi:hypothetical protein